MWVWPWGRRGRSVDRRHRSRAAGRFRPQARRTGSPAAAEGARPSRGRTWMAFVLGGLALAAGIALALRTAGRRPDTVRRDPARSVLLITIDTLRADALGSYGHPTVATPFMDRLAAEGVRFEQAHAQNVVTLPSHANILTGRYPLDHGIRDNAGFRVPAGTETLATLLEKAGYRTAAFVSAFPLDSRFGLDRGFDVYDDRLGDPESRTAFVDAGAARAGGGGGGARVARRAGRREDVRVGAPLRAALPVRAACALHGRASRTTSTTARCRTPTRCFSRSSSRCSSGRDRSKPGDPDRRPRRGPGRARRGHPRHLRLRGHAAGSPHPARARAAAAARGGRSRPPHRPPADGARRARTRGARRISPAAASSPRPTATPLLPPPATSRPCRRP